MPKSYLAALLRRRWLVGGGYRQAEGGLTCERMGENMGHYGPHNSAAARRRAAGVTAGDWGRVTSFFEMSGELDELVRGARREPIMQPAFFSTPGERAGNEEWTDARWQGCWSGRCCRRRCVAEVRETSAGNGGIAQTPRFWCCRCPFCAVPAWEAGALCGANGGSPPDRSGCWNSRATRTRSAPPD